MHGAANAPLDPVDAQSPIRVDGLTNDTPYNLRLRAVNAVGPGPESEPVSVTPGSADMILTVDVQDGDRIVLPLGGTYDVFVDWGDGDSTSATSDAATLVDHTYDVAGTFDIRINGTLESFGYQQYVGADLITAVRNWGSLGLRSLSFAFNFAVNLTELPSEFPDTVTDASILFSGARSFNDDIGSWDTSNVTNMRSMFSGASTFFQNISSWCVSLIGSAPRSFATGSGFESFPALQPQWGTCPP